MFDFFWTSTFTLDKTQALPPHDKYVGAGSILTWIVFGIYHSGGILWPRHPSANAWDLLTLFHVRIYISVRSFLVWARNDVIQYAPVTTIPSH